MRTADSDYSEYRPEYVYPPFFPAVRNPARYHPPPGEGETIEEFIARETDENPTFLEMTQASLDFLSKDEDGFFLMVEQGDMDWVLHDNNMDNLLGTVYDLDDAVEHTIDWIEDNGGWEENLLIVTGRPRSLPDPE